MRPNNSINSDWQKLRRFGQQLLPAGYAERWAYRLLSMKKKFTIYQKAENEIQSQNYYRAKEILQGSISNFGYDAKLFEKLGSVLNLMGDKIEAGRFLFLSGVRCPEYSEPIRLFLKRFAGKVPRNLLGTFPKVARKKDIKEYPEAVISKLNELGITNENLFWNEPSYNGKYKETLTDKLFPIGIICILLFLLLCAVIGLIDIGKWALKCFLP